MFARAKERAGFLFGGSTSQDPPQPRKIIRPGDHGGHHHGHGGEGNVKPAPVVHSKSEPVMKHEPTGGAKEKKGDNHHEDTGKKKKEEEEEEMEKPVLGNIVELEEGAKGQKKVEPKGAKSAAAHDPSLSMLDREAATIAEQQKLNELDQLLDDGVVTPREASPGPAPKKDATQPVKKKTSTTTTTTPVKKTTTRPVVDDDDDDPFADVDDDWGMSKTKSAPPVAKPSAHAKSDLSILEDALNDADGGGQKKSSPRPLPEASPRTLQSLRELDDLLAGQNDDSGDEQDDHRVKGKSPVAAAGRGPATRAKEEPSVAKIVAPVSKAVAKVLDDDPFAALSRDSDAPMSPAVVKKAEPVKKEVVKTAPMKKPVKSLYDDDDEEEEQKKAEPPSTNPVVLNVAKVKSVYDSDDESPDPVQAVSPKKEAPKEPVKKDDDDEFFEQAVAVAPTVAKLKGPGSGSSRSVIEDKVVAKVAKQPRTKTVGASAPPKLPVKAAAAAEDEEDPFGDFKMLPDDFSFDDDDAFSSKALGTAPKASVPPKAVPVKVVAKAPPAKTSPRKQIVEDDDEDPFEAEEKRAAKVSPRAETPVPAKVSPRTEVEIKPKKPSVPAVVEEEDVFGEDPVPLKSPGRSVPPAKKPAVVEEEDDFFAEEPVKKPTSPKAVPPVKKPAVEDDFFVEEPVKKPTSPKAVPPVKKPAEEDDFFAEEPVPVKSPGKVAPKKPVEDAEVVQPKSPTVVKKPEEPVVQQDGPKKLSAEESRAARVAARLGLTATPAKTEPTVVVAEEPKIVVVEQEKPAESVPAPVKTYVRPASAVRRPSAPPSPRPAEEAAGEDGHVKPTPSKSLTKVGATSPRVKSPRPPGEDAKPPSPRPEDGGSAKAAVSPRRPTAPRVVSPRPPPAKGLAKAPPAKVVETPPAAAEGESSGSEEDDNNADEDVDDVAIAERFLAAKKQALEKGKQQQEKPKVADVQKEKQDAKQIRDKVTAAWQQFQRFYDEKLSVLDLLKDPGSNAQETAEIIEELKKECVQIKEECKKKADPLVALIRDAGNATTLQESVVTDLVNALPDKEKVLVTGLLRVLKEQQDDEARIAKMEQERLDEEREREEQERRILEEQERLRLEQERREQERQKQEEEESQKRQQEMEEAARKIVEEKLRQEEEERQQQDEKSREEKLAEEKKLAEERERQEQERRAAKREAASRAARELVAKKKAERDAQFGIVKPASEGMSSSSDSVIESVGPDADATAEEVAAASDGPSKVSSSAASSVIEDGEIRVRGIDSEKERAIRAKMAAREAARKNREKK